MILLIEHSKDFLIKKINKKTLFKLPLFIVFILTIIKISPLLYININLIKYFSTEGKIMLIFFIITVIGEFLINLLIWFIISGTIYSISIKHYKDTYFKKIFELSGYGFIPLILGNLIHSIYFIFTLNKVNYKGNELEKVFTTITNQLDFKGYLLTFIDIIFLILSIIIWINILKYYSDMKVKKYYIISSVIVIIYLIYKIII